MRPVTTGERGGFAALLAVATAAERQDAAGLEAALGSVPTATLLRAAARHRCLGYLRKCVVAAGVRSEAARTVIVALREYAGRAAVQAYVTRAQIASIVTTLEAAGVSFVLLKGAARLFRRDSDSDDAMMYDLDLLVPAEEGASAAAVLERQGYHRESAHRSADDYWQHHHHLIPLIPDRPGLPIELHVQLARRGMLSTATDWGALEPLFERVTRDDATALCLDPLGTALHLMVHGAGVKRLHDAIMLGRILADRPEILTALFAKLAAEHAQPIPLAATLVVAARIAGLECEAPAAVETYLRWVRRREDLAPFVRERSQFADAWYGNGRRVWGAGTVLALPDRHTAEGAIVASTRFAYRVVGRLITSAVAVVAR